ncbi:MAG: glycosyltransferase family 39 protein [Acidobacteriota bacterium]
MIRTLQWAVAASWTLTVALWLLFVAQHPAPQWISQLVAICAIGSTLALVVTSTVAAWRRGESSRVLALGAVVLLSLVIHIVGIEHEVGEQYYQDEGTYRHHANEINNGNFLRPSYFYPHLLYYIDAFATWLAALGSKPVLAASGWVFGVSDWAIFCRLLGRLITAVLAGLTVVPIFRLAERFGGLYAGSVAGLLIGFAPVYNHGAHVNTSDVPSAFFAAMALDAVGRLLQGENRRDYVLAGVYAGLAAGTKYPAGVVAIAIVAVYLKWRLSERRFSWSLAWAGIPSLLVFLMTTPGLALFPQESIFGSKGALFGFRQYSRGGWIGVVVDSNWVYYGKLILASFAWPAIILGLLGLLLLQGKRRIQAMWLLPFPVLYVSLISSMNMVVERNLYPGLPAIAALLGIGIWALREALAPRLPGRQNLLAVALAGACLIVPFVQVVAQDMGYAGASTRRVSAQWIYDHLPHGTSILKERYTPNLFSNAFKVQKTRWAGSYTVDGLLATDFDFVVLASTAFERFMRPELHFRDYHKLTERNYREIFERLELVQEIGPHRTRRGPRVLIYKVAVDEGQVPAVQEIDARAPIVRKLRTRPEHAGRIEYLPTHRWRTLRASLASGPHRLELVGETSDYSLLSVVDLDDREVDFAEMRLDRTFDILIEDPGRYLLRFFMDKDKPLETVRILRDPPDPAVLLEVGAGPVRSGNPSRP